MTAREWSKKIEEEAFDPWTMNKEQKQYMGAFYLDECDKVFEDFRREVERQCAERISEASFDEDLNFEGPETFERIICAAITAPAKEDKP